MTDTSFMGDHATIVRETYPAASQAGAAEVIPSGVLVIGYELTNFHTVAITISGVPIEDGISLENAARIGSIVPASGTISSSLPFVAESGLKFYSTSAGGTNSVVHIYTNL